MTPEEGGTLRIISRQEFQLHRCYNDLNAYNQYLLLVIAERLLLNQTGTENTESQTKPQTLYIVK